jgi:type IV/VI secretion system ImpK/VasF family protein
MASSLREVFTPLIAYTLLFTRTPEEQQRPFGEIRGAIEKLFEQHREAIKRSDISAQDYESGCFALVAWIDEMILHYSAESNRTLYDEWRRSPLQVGRFNTANAGEEFFERLARLTPAQKQVYEIYFLALCLGFRGRYYDEAQEPQLIELRRQCAAHLPVPPIDLFEFEQRLGHLTVQPYEVVTPPLKLPASPLSPYWIALPVVAAAALLLYLIPRAPNRQDIENAIRTLQCAQVTVADVQHSVVKLSGHVESKDQLDLMRQKVEAVPHVKGVNGDEVRVIPRPFCEVMEVLAPLRARNEKGGAQLELRPSNGCDATYHDNDPLILDITAGKPLNYLYIDYYVADRQSVAHVFPNPEEPDPDVKQTQARTIGGPYDKSQWKIQRPFGREMVTVISSPKPLLTPARLAPEAAEEYLAQLRKSLQGNASDPALTATYCFIKSE